MSGDKSRDVSRVDRKGLFDNKDISARAETSSVLEREGEIALSVYNYFE